MEALDKVLKVTGTSRESLATVCDDAVFKVSIKHIKAYDSLAIYLDLRDNEVEDITRSHASEDVKRMKVLRKWKTKNGTDATHLALITVLLEMEDRITAEAVAAHVKATPSIVNNPAPVMGKRFLDRIVPQLMQLQPQAQDGRLAVYQPSLQVDVVDRHGKFIKYSIGSSKGKSGVGAFVSEKVVLVVGATGVGKSTLINGMVNYIFGVEYEDNVRIKMITGEHSRSPAHSQTDKVTSYTFHWQEGFPFPYTLTIIDTPGFGDTRGIERDKEIIYQIKHFFELRPQNGGITALDGIALVTQASIFRLTPTQRYIFDSILSMFGKDVADNIYIMATFADGGEPPVINAFRQAGIQDKPCFQFNNSALFSDNSDGFEKMFWRMGEQSYKDFFDSLSHTNAVSLQLTREVLDERELISRLVHDIKCGLLKIDQKKEDLKSIEADILASENYTYTVEVVKINKIDLQPEKEQRTYEGLKKKYNESINQKQQMVKTISKLEKEADSTKQQLNRHLRCLNEIALRPNPLRDLEYIDLLIESEKRQAGSGYEKRIQYLQKARYDAEVMKGSASAVETYMFKLRKFLK